MPTRTAKAVWMDTVKKGQGALELGSGSYKGQYSYGSRFEEAGGTNPEELLGAAHTACFSMAFSLRLVEAGYTPKSISPQAAVNLDAEKLAITSIDLRCIADVSDIDEDRFREIAEEAKAGCPVSKALTGVTINLDASLK
ncbi:MAG: OsmC family peroxiredoxin [Spirochaeta sp.]|jgi:osmotically inducible protein OsmC|nr:OsmC family peroxiredoxin [Spirochaeta sp.]